MFLGNEEVDGRNRTIDMFLLHNHAAKTITETRLITSNQSYESSNEVIMFTGGDYICLEIEIKQVHVSDVQKCVMCCNTYTFYKFTPCACVTKTCKVEQEDIAVSCSFCINL